jgi:hypothetical protein
MFSASATHASHWKRALTFPNFSDAYAFVGRRATTCSNSSRRNGKTPAQGQIPFGGALHIIGRFGFHLKKRRWISTLQ